MSSLETRTKKQILAWIAPNPTLPRGERGAYAVAAVLDLAVKEYERVIGPPPADGFVGRVYYFQDSKYKEPFEKKICAPTTDSPGKYSPIHRIVYIARETDQGKINAAGAEERFPTLLHEAAHQYLWRLLEAPPTWLDEGLATYFARYRANLAKKQLVPTPEAKNPSWIDDRMLKMAEEGLVLGFQELMTMDFERFHKFIDAKNNQGNQYCQSCAILRYWLDAHGTDKYLKSVGGGRNLFNALFSLYRKGVKPQDAFDQVLGSKSRVDCKKLQNEWLSFVSKSFR